MKKYFIQILHILYNSILIHLNLFLEKNLANKHLQKLPSINISRHWDCTLLLLAYLNNLSYLILSLIEVPKQFHLQELLGKTCSQASANFYQVLMGLRIIYHENFFPLLSYFNQGLQIRSHCFDFFYTFRFYLFKKILSILNK